jgi:3-dehydroquinate synthase
VEFRNGLAEIVKIAAALDGDFFRFLERNVRRIARSNTRLLIRLIHRAVALKAAVVQKDERESGLRKSLNLGHTIGHAIEATTNFAVKHGQAVAMGLVAESHLALNAGLLSVEDHNRLTRLLGQCGLPTQMPPGIKAKDFFRAMSVDKKNTGSDPAFVLLRRIGVSLIGVRLPAPMIQTLVQ